LEDANTSIEYVKHSVKLGGEKAGGWLVYGVNASGKSSLMKATGIAVLLAQAGCFVPATSMIFRPYDATFSRIWNHDNIWAGLSSFAVEVGELRDILKNATGRSLVLGDEVCSGTESVSATSLVASTLEYLESKGCHFMFATHLHDLLKIPNFLPRTGISVWHLRVIRTNDGKLIYDRRLQEGCGDSTYGLEVAKAMGLPFSIMERAYEIRKQLHGEDIKRSSWNSSIYIYECEMCHTRISNELEVHHVERRADGGSNNVRNLTVLCEKCHDEHHNGTKIVYPAVQTSDGIERIASQAPSQAALQQSPKSKWSKEDMETINSTLIRLKGRPMDRIRADLKENGLNISAAQLSKFRL
jgi:DNA mismatch repair protein MutS